MKKKQFFKNAAILTITALILRGVGMLFRVYLADKVGCEGMGLYQLIISVYMLASTFATTGVNTAITRLITDELVCGSKKSVGAILKRAIFLITVIGIASSLLIYNFAPFISINFIKDSRAIPALKILAFSLPFMGICSCIKGYFIARRKVAGNSSAQLIEQFIRMCIVIFLLGKFAHLGVELCCAIILLGDTVAEASSCLYMIICYFVDKRKIKVVPAVFAPQKRVYKKLLKIAIPISSGKYLSTGLRTAENMLVPLSLGKFCNSKADGLSQFGMLKGMALPIIFFPSSFLMALSMLLIPEISEAAALNNQGIIKSTTSKTIKITMILSLVISGAFSLFAEDVGICVYKDIGVGFFIKVLSPLIPFMYLESVVDGLLKGMNQQNYSFLYAVMDSALRIILIIFLVPRFGMAGFLFMMVLSNVFTSTLNIRRLVKVCHIDFLWKDWIIKPLVLTLISSGATYLIVFGLINASLSPQRLIVGTLLICLIYFPLCFLSGVINKNDINFIKRKTATK